MYTGVVLVVGGLCGAHALTHEYSWSGSAPVRPGLWATPPSCALAGYSVGLPEQPRTRRGALVAALLAAGVAAMTISVVQLFLGDALLPRFVVLGSAVILVPWFVLCAALSHDVDARAGERDRVVVVATADEMVVLEADLVHAPERPAVLVGGAHRTRPSTPGGERQAHHWSTWRASVRRRSSCWSRQAQNEEDVVIQATSLHQLGLRIRTLSMFYEQWLGKIPINELERVSLLFDIGELHAVSYARIKRLLDTALAVCGLIALALVTPDRGDRQLLREPAGSCSTATTARRAERRDVRDAEVPHDASVVLGARCRHDRVGRRRASRHSVACCAAHTSTSCPRCSTSCAASCPSSGRVPSSPRSSPS